jgi:hypothetical protein
MTGISLVGFMTGLLLLVARDGRTVIAAPWVLARIDPDGVIARPRPEVMDEARESQ